MKGAVTCKDEGQSRAVLPDTELQTASSPLRHDCMGTRTHVSAPQVDRVQQKKRLVDLATTLSIQSGLGPCITQCVESRAGCRHCIQLDAMPAKVCGVFVCMPARAVRHTAHHLSCCAAGGAFEEIFMTSALLGDGIPELREYLLSQ